MNTHSAEAPSLRIAVGIATRGRAPILTDTLLDLASQTRAPDRVIVCGTEPADVASVAERVPRPVEILFAPSGLPRQRNAILDQLDGFDIVLFLDDDLVMGPRYVESTLAAFQAHENLVVTTGTLLADDSRGPGLTFEAGRALLDADPDPSATGLERAPHGYGCNMAIRLSVAREHAIRFDERLPLYAWSEDIDFTHRMARHGWIAKLHGARGVHLGTKQGRQPGRRLGYSQVANPVYLYNKGSYSFGRAARSVGRNILMNAARSLRPEAYIDRRGRLGGNVVACLDMLRGRLAPERILKL